MISGKYTTPTPTPTPTTTTTTTTTPTATTTTIYKRLAKTIKIGISVFFGSINIAIAEKNASVICV